MYPRTPLPFRFLNTPLVVVVVVVVVVVELTGVPCYDESVQ